MPLYLKENRKLTKVNKTIKPKNILSSSKWDSKETFDIVIFLKYFCIKILKLMIIIRKILTYNSKSFSTFSFIKLWNVAYLSLKMQELIIEYF